MNESNQYNYFRYGRDLDNSNGNLMATIICPRFRPQMSTVRPGVMKKRDPIEGAEGELIEFKPMIKAEDIRTQVVEIVKSAKELVSLTDAEIIVSGGNGLGSAEGFNLIEKLSEKVGGVVGASRAAVDAGWIDHSHQVGQTGTKYSDYCRYPNQQWQGRK